MFLDACAIVSILSDEADAASYARALQDASAPITSALATWEAIVVLSRPEKLGRPLLEVEQLVCEWLADNRIELHSARSSERELLHNAIHALATFGGGPNRLNALDCFHYAYAKAAAATLLTYDRLLRATDIPTAP